MTYELKTIEKLVNQSNGCKSFDSWSNTHSLYLFLIEEFKEKGINSFTGESGKYIVYFTSGRNGRGGMDNGTPDTMIVEKMKLR